jgi:hypothetical protein
MMYLAFFMKLDESKRFTAKAMMATTFGQVLRERQRERERQRQR